MKGTERDCQILWDQNFLLSWVDHKCALRSNFLLCLVVHTIRWFFTIQLFHIIVIHWFLLKCRSSVIVFVNLLCSPIYVCVMCVFSSSQFSLYIFFLVVSTIVFISFMITFSASPFLMLSEGFHLWFLCNAFEHHCILDVTNFTFC